MTRCTKQFWRTCLAAMLMVGVATTLLACDDEKPEASESSGGDEKPESSSEEAKVDKKDPDRKPKDTKKKTVRATKPDQKVANNTLPAPQPNGGDQGAKPKTKGAKPVMVSKSFLRVEKMLDKQDIREATGYTGLLSRDEVAGQDPTKQYNATRWAAEGADLYGFALEVWKPGSSTAATKLFSQLYAQSINGERTSDLGDQAFRTEHHKIRTVTFLDRRKSTIAAVSCASGLCEFEKLVELAQRVQRKL